MNMLNQRSIQRHQLPYYLNVFNRYTDKPLGFIGNLSEGGLMLISPYPMMTDVRFDMRLKIPGQHGQLRCVDFSATCLWSREDVTPGSFDSGFALISPPAEIRDMIDALHHYFSFRPIQHIPPARLPRTDPPTHRVDQDRCHGT
ncbi:PilZ domain-containing protein [Stutzerimonas marianensis]|uniref:PilZ domain-containing protein n=1 Tax=Stutzerimonas marianensis TaxID=2929513 RepID=A0A9X1W2H6_9GAMM|nr:PilZ domain-containing protein [Pseudomonas marianensis]MCJ0973976.1 PilZ domain-containing protein [Pseudomonas marianensis]